MRDEGEVRVVGVREEKEEKDHNKGNERRKNKEKKGIGKEEE